MSLILGLGLGFFCVLGLGLEPCVLDSTSGAESSLCPKCSLENETPNHHVGNCKLYQDICVKYFGITKTTVHNVVTKCSINMHRAGQRCFELLVLIRSPGSGTASESRYDFPGVDHEGRETYRLCNINILTTYLKETGRLSEFD